MAPEKHAILSASSAFRWINCPPSALLNALIPDESSPYAEEGTKAHAYCEYLLLQALGQKAEKPNFSPTEEMIEAARGYRNYICDHTAPGAEFFIEQRVDYSAWAPEGFGTVDCLAVESNTEKVKVFDFKYGQGVEVDAEWNPQLLCYALGAYGMLEPLYRIANYELHIYQPRRNHVSSFRLSFEELLNWACYTLKPAAQLAWAGHGDAHAGEWCRFCKAKPNCIVLAEQNMELAGLDFPEPLSMSSREIERILPKLDLLIDWAGSLKEYALRQAVAGQKFDGWKLVEGRSVRRFRSEADACLRIKEAGFNPYITKMKGLTELKKEMGAKNFEDVCGGLLEKPAGKPALVPETDKRPAWNPAAADFTE